MFGKSATLQVENEALKQELERLKFALVEAQQQARENWQRYEKIFYEYQQLQSSTLSLEQYHANVAKFQDEIARKDAEIMSFNNMLAEEMMAHEHTQNVLDRKKQQCKRYKRLNEKLKEAQKQVFTG